MKKKKEEVEPVAVLIRVRGQVQGVGFRYYTMVKARNYDLTGYVKNLSDGAVEAYAEGDKEKLEKLVRDLTRGPIGSEVEDVDTTWREAKDHHEEFNIDF